MYFSVPVLISVSIIPVLMILFGFLWKYYPPKNINWIYGYRTKRSMKNNETWQFAQLYLSKLWRWGGIVMLGLAVIFSLNFTKSYEEISGWVFYIELGFMILTTLMTEIALYRKFNSGDDLH